MADLYAISQAIAARFAAGQVTPPSGFTNIRVATANPPGSMAALPCVIVFPDSGNVDALPSRAGTRVTTHQFTVRFYYGQAGDLARDAVALQKWTAVLMDQLKTSVQFAGAIPYVTRAWVDSYKLGYLTYGGKEYSGVELAVSVVTSEPWAAVA